MAEAGLSGAAAGAVEERAGLAGSVAESFGTEPDLDPCAIQLARFGVRTACRRAVLEGDAALQVAGNEGLDEIQTDVSVTDRIEVRREPLAIVVN